MVRWQDTVRPATKSEYDDDLMGVRLPDERHDEARMDTVDAREPTECCRVR